METIAIVNPKGGVGKTTTAVHLAAALSKKNRVLLIDLDDQLYTTSWVGVEPSDNLLLTMLGKESLSPVSVPLGFSVAAASPGLSSLSDEVRQTLALRTRQYQLLADALEASANDFDIVILDCPGDLDDITINALFAADRVILTIKTAFLSASSLGATLGQLTELAEAQRREIPVRILLGMFQKTKKGHRQIVDFVQDELPGKYFKSIIPFNVRIEEAPSFHTTVLQSEPKGAAAKSYRSLAREVLQWLA